MNRSFRYITLVLFFAAIAAGCPRSTDSSVDPFDSAPPVAVVADRMISAEEYRRTYVDYLLDTGLQDEPTRREAFLRRMVNVRLIAETEREAGIERTEAYLERARTVSAKLLVSSFVEEEIFSGIEITEDDLRDMFVRANTEMTVRHLYASSAEAADRLRSRLAGGETFDELAKEVFDDPRLASTGGLLGPFGFDEMDPAFEEAAFNLPRGEISRPVRTANGYSILRVEERTMKPLVTETEFAERRDRLEAEVAFRKKAQARAEYLAVLMEELDPVFEAATLEALATQVFTGRPAKAESLTDDAVLVRLGGADDDWTVGDFRTAASLATEEQVARIRSARDLTTFAEGLIAREEMIRRARAAQLDESSRYRTAFRAEMDRWIYDRSYTRIVEAIQVPPDTVRTYWQTFGDELMTDPMVDVREIVVRTPEDRDRVKAELGTTPFETVARRLGVRMNDEGERGGLVRMNREQLGLFADRVFAADAGDVIGPQDVGGATVWIQVAAHHPSRTMTFDEAAPRIERMIRWSKRQDVLRAAADRVRKTVSVQTWPERALSMDLASDAGSLTDDLPEARSLTGSAPPVRSTAADASPSQHSLKPRDIGS